ncbi:hypothetical protein [Burkholderia pseudomultivorans]|uniref:hypothetical protein n=1 Tax=Burkholderia pseudomultivorans TaxID=1207504 RepID=UPI0028702329|nr:hypothetical protein [Burkholderia pseudomultivorans]
MSKLKDLVIRHSADIRQMQRVAIEAIAAALESATHVDELKGAIREALDTLADRQKAAEERYSVKLQEIDRSARKHHGN